MEIRQSLEANFLTCKICEQPFRKPKVLECLHSFCLACLDDLLQKEKQAEREKTSYSSATSSSSYYTPSRRKWSRDLKYGAYYNNYSSDYSSSANKDYKIKCPVCQKKTTIDKGSCSGLPDDLLAGKLASMVGKIPNYPICDVCTPDTIIPGLQPPSSGFRSGRSGGEGASSSGASSKDENLETSSTYSSGRVRRKHHRKKQQQSIVLSQPSAMRSSADIGEFNAEPRRAVSACLDCGKRLCDYCQVTHSNMPVTAEHILIRVEEMEEMRCPRHPREMRRFYCRTCECCICLVCTFDSADQRSSISELGHSEHNIMSLRQAVDAYQAQIDNDTNEAQIQVEQLERLMDGIRICETHLTSLTKSIDSAADSMVAEIRQRQNQLKAELKVKLGFDPDDLDPKCNSINSAIEGWYQITKDETFTERLDLMNPIEALDSAIPLVDRIKEALATAEAQTEPTSKWQRLYDQLHCSPRSTLNGDAAETAESDCESILSNSSSGKKSAMKKKKVAFKLDFEEPPDLNYWVNLLGRFYVGTSAKLGRILKPEEYSAEQKALANKWKDVGLQADPLVIIERRHAAIQANYFEAHQNDFSMQTETTPIILKIDNGTQYQSSDVNPPMILFRGGKQISVQK
ncbi:Tripartite motif-containing protein 45 [Cichlidogyrus casuarinus]|uniref:Tripartite motif-containing protein 45 n=1 Tax=Cichlidogyrus casuarinus TaxID=1844966 RepID=A0ABD2PT94_9PLAT